MSAITFIIPAFNAAATLPDTLRSVLGQSRTDWRTIVVDDGSSDGTSAVAADFRDERLSVVRQENAGVAVARNRGLAIATTSHVAFVDSDDTIEPEFAEEMLGAIGEHDLVAGAYRYSGPSLEEAGWVVAPGEPGDLKEFNQFAIGAIVFRREALLRVGAPMEGPFPRGSHHEDWEVLLALRGARWAPPVARPVYTYRLRPDSRTTALCEVWRGGLNLIAKVHEDPAARERALRRWTLRNLARAATMDNARLCRQMFEHLDSLTSFDTDTLSGALRWSLRRAMVAREKRASLPRELWHQQILACLGDSELAREALRRAAGPDWGKVAAAVEARLRPGQTLVIYGAGRNGRELIGHLASRSVPIALIDDSPAAPPAGVVRLTLGDLTERHLVLVTPDDRVSILARLGANPNAQILLPEQLVA